MLVTGQDQIRWRLSSQTAAHLERQSSRTTWRRPATRALEQETPEQSATHGVIFTVPEKPQMLLDYGHIATFLHPRPVTVGGRTDRAHRQDVARQNFDQLG